MELAIKAQQQAEKQALRDAAEAERAKKFEEEQRAKEERLKLLKEEMDKEKEKSKASSSQFARGPPMDQQHHHVGAPVQPASEADSTGNWRENTKPVEVGLSLPLVSFDSTFQTRAAQQPVQHIQPASEANTVSDWRKVAKPIEVLFPSVYKISLLAGAATSSPGPAPERRGQGPVASWQCGRDGGPTAAGQDDRRSDGVEEGNQVRTAQSTRRRCTRRAGICHYGEPLCRTQRGLKAMSQHGHCSAVISFENILALCSFILDHSCRARFCSNTIPSRYHQPTIV